MKPKPKVSEELAELLVKCNRARLSHNTLYDLYKNARYEYDVYKSQILELTKGEQDDK